MPRELCNIVYTKLMVATSRILCKPCKKLIAKTCNTVKKEANARRRSNKTCSSVPNMTVESHSAKTSGKIDNVAEVSRQICSTRVTTDLAFSSLLSAMYWAMYLTAAEGRANVPKTWTRVSVKLRRAKTPISSVVSVWARITKYTRLMRAEIKPWTKRQVAPRATLAVGRKPDNE